MGYLVLDYTWHLRSGREKAEISPRLDRKRRQLSVMSGFWWRHTVLYTVDHPE